MAFNADREILALTGPSGSGKTMTLLCIAGLIRPDEGYVRLNGKALWDSVRGLSLPPRQRKVGFVFQNYALFPHLTVYDNIAFGIRRLPRREVDERVSRLLDGMNIQGLGHRYPGQLSGGQQQRVAVALCPGRTRSLIDGRTLFGAGCSCKGVPGRNSRVSPSGSGRSTLT